MPASAPLTAIRPRRGLVRSSVLGMGLLVAGSAVASPALAEEEGTDPGDVDLDAGQPVELSATAGPLVTDEEWTSTSPTGFEVPAADFGMSKTFSIDLSAPKDAPEDLSLAGAQFELVRSTGSIEGTCTTTHDGGCSFYSLAHPFATPSESNAEVEAGYMYMLRQSRRSTGLALLPGDLGTVYICGGGECSGGRYAYFTPDSLFHRTLDGIATEAGSGSALAGRTFALTGPTYPRNDGTGAPVSGAWGTATSDDDGALSWSGWFLPGDYALSAVADGDGPLSGEPAEVTFADWAPFQEGRPSVEMALRYVRPAVEPGDGGASDGGTGETPGAPGEGGSQGGAGEGTVVPGGGTAPATGAPSTGSPSTGSPAPGSPARPSAVDEAPKPGGNQGVPAGKPVRPAVGDPTAGVAPGASAPEAPERPSAVVAGLGVVELPSAATPTAVPAPTSAAPRPAAAPPVFAATSASPRLETASSGVSELQVIGLGALLVSTVGAGFLLLRMRRRDRDA